MHIVTDPEPAAGLFIPNGWANPKKRMIKNLRNSDSEHTTKRYCVEITGRNCRVCSLPLCATVGHEMIERKWWRVESMRMRMIGIARAMN